MLGKELSCRSGSVFEPDDMGAGKFKPDHLTFSFFSLPVGQIAVPALAAKRIGFNLTSGR